MAGPAPRKQPASAVAETARVAPAWSLVFRRMLRSATPTTLAPFARALASLAAVSQNRAVKATAGVAPILQGNVSAPATVLPGSSAIPLGTRASVLWRARRDDSQGSVLTQ